MSAFHELSTGWLVFRLIVLVAVVAGMARAGLIVYWLLRYVQWGQGGRILDQLPERIRGFMVYVIGQKRVIAEPAGILHLFIFWGFLALQLETVEYLVRGAFFNFHLGSIIGIGPYSAMLFVQDIMAGMILVSLAMLGVRRFVLKPKHVAPSMDALVILGFIAGLMVTKFIANGAEIAFTTPQTLGHHASWTPIANAFAGALRAVGATPESTGMFWIHHFSYAIHIGIVAAFANYVPSGKHLHLIGAMPNVFFRKLTPAGALAPMDLESEDVESYGVAHVEDLAWKQLLDTYACTECGRCEHYCPAYNSGKPLNPMMIVHKVKDALREKGEYSIKNKLEGADDKLERLNGGWITAEELWSCTTCGACVANCPVFIEHVDTIIDLRRYLAMTEADIPKELSRTYKNMEQKSNPWGVNNKDRGAWADGLDIPLLSDLEEPPEYLFWVGCAGSFDDRQKKVSKAFAKLMKAAGVSFAILGPEENCTGDTARRTGNEYLYWTLASTNIEILNTYKVTKIVTTCPHCFHTIGKEYPQLGGHYEVIHHTELLNALIREQKLNFQGSGHTRVTYHDSCYANRWVDEYDNARNAISSVPGVELVEMQLNKKQSYCCGAGGGNMWMEEHIGKRINLERTDQALATKPDAIAVGCPFCLTMFDDGVKNRDANVPIFDMSEILANNLAPADAVADDEAAAAE